MQLRYGTFRVVAETMAALVAGGETTDAGKGRWPKGGRRPEHEPS